MLGLLKGMEKRLQSDRLDGTAQSIETRPWWQYLIAAFILSSTYSGFGLFEKYAGSGWLGTLVWLTHHSINPQILLFASAVLIIANRLLFSNKTVVRLAEIVAFNPEDRPESPRLRKSGWLLAGFVFLGSMFFLLEKIQPMYFSRDDNTVQFLPMMVYAGRSLVHGSFPEWNPYQFMGIPIASQGIYALTYPVTYLAYLFAHVLGNELFTIEIFVIVHLVAGFFSMAWASSVYRVRPSIAVLAGLCSALSGFALIASRNWYYMSPVFVYVPLILGGIEKIRVSHSRWPWSLFLGAVTGLFFHAGNAQMWAYTCLFVTAAVGLCFAFRAFRAQELLWFIPSGLIAIGLSLPLLLVQAQMTKDVTRPMAAGVGNVQFHSLWSFLLPGSWLGIRYATDWGPGTDGLHGAEMLYSGTVFIVAALFVPFLVLIYRFQLKRIVRDNVWVICAFAACNLSMGANSFLWPFLLRVPEFDKFRVPFKFVALTTLFATLAGAIILERIALALPQKRWIEPLLFSPVLVLLSIHCTLARTSFYQYVDSIYDAPGPVLTSYLKPKDGSPVRFAPIIPIRSRALDYGKGLPLDLPTLHRVYSIAGLDGLMDWDPYQLQTHMLSHHVPWNFLQEFGVKYVLIHRLTDEALGSPGRQLLGIERQILLEPVLEKAARSQGRLVYHDESVELYAVDGVRPLAFCPSFPTVDLPVQFTASGAIINTINSPPSDQIVLNVLWRPAMRAYADGKQIKIQTDPWGRVLARVPTSSHQIEVKFQPNWGKAAMAGTGITFLGLLSMVFLARRSRKSFSVASAVRVEDHASAQGK